MSGLRTRLTLKPGRPGTKQLLAEYGDRLLCVRYRYDDERHLRYKTAEVIVEETPWTPTAPFAPTDIVDLRIRPQERTLRTEIDVPNPKGKLLPGMYVQASITVDHPNVWTLPAGAVVTGGDQTFCFRVEDGKAVRTLLQVGLSGGPLGAGRFSWRAVQKILGHLAHCAVLAVYLIVHLAHRFGGDFS